MAKTKQGITVNVSWAAVLAAVLFVVAVGLGVYGVADNNQAILDLSGILAVVGVGFGILSQRDA